MTLLEQCGIWNENDEYEKIINAIEGIPSGDRSPELDSELARAYNNAADADDKDLFQKAVALLRPHEEYFKGDHCWNFRIAYACFYLNQEGVALRYFLQALEARPGDEDTQKFIDECRRRLSLPMFYKNFRERTREAWAAFEQEEAKLRGLLDRKNRADAEADLMETCGDVLKLVFANPSFEIGFNGKKYELILSAEGNKARLFELVYFQRHAPASVLEHWNILVGRQPSRGFGLRSNGWEVSGEDVRVWVEKREDKISLTLFCEKLLPLLREDENRAWWMLSLLADQVLGEIASIALICGFEVAETPPKGSSVSLDELPKALTEMELNIDRTAEEYLDNCYTVYWLEPNEEPEADWRLDVYAGNTRCEPLINDYLNAENITMDAYHADGAVAGFLCYPLDGFVGENRGKEVLDFRDALEAAVMEAAGEDAVTFIGGASGIYCGYLDFIAWDLPAVLDAALEFFEKSTLKSADFHVFRRDVGTVRLLDRPNR